MVFKIFNSQSLIQLQTPKLYYLYSRSENNYVTTEVNPTATTIHMRLPILIDNGNSIKHIMILINFLRKSRCLLLNEYQYNKRNKLLTFTKIASKTNDKI